MELELSIELWKYIFGYLSSEEIEDLKTQGFFTKGDLKQNDGLWKYLYIEAFSQITQNSQLSLELKEQREDGSVKGFFKDYTQVSKETQELYDNYNYSIENNRIERSLWFDAFKVDWNRFLHIYEDENTHKVLKYDYPKTNQPLFDLWIDFKYKIDIENRNHWIEFGINMHKKKSISLDEYSVFENFFENNGIVLRFRYTPTKEEAKNSIPETIEDRVLINENGEVIDSSVIDDILKHENKKKRPVILNVDFTKDKNTLFMKNTSFLKKQPMKTDFHIGIFITKEREIYTERTFEYTQIQNKLVGKQFDAVKHDISLNNTEKKNSIQSKEVRKLLLSNRSKIDT